MTKTKEKLASLCLDEIKKYTVLLVEQRDELLAALENAHEFISNGIEFGFIKMPDEIDDPAHKTLPIISEALAKAKGQ